MHVSWNSRPNKSSQPLLSASVYWKFWVSIEFFMDMLHFFSHLFHMHGKVEGCRKKRKKFSAYLQCLSFDYFINVHFLFYFILSISNSPFFVDEYGVSGYWCWVKYPGTSKSVRNVLFVFTLFIYLWLAIIYNSVMIFLTIRFFRSKENQILLSLYNQKLKKTLMFPIIMVVMWTIPSIYRLFQIFDEEIFALSLIHVICEGLNGLVNTIFYVWSKKFKNELRKSIRLPGEQLLINNI